MEIAAGQADEEAVTSANKSKIFQCYDALCNVMKDTDNKKLAYHTFEAIAQDFAEDEYVYFFRTPENAELYDNFRAYTNKLLYQI